MNNNANHGIMYRRFRELVRFLGQCVFGVIRDNNSYYGGRLRSKWLNTSAVIDIGVTVANKKNFSCGTECALYYGTYILNSNGKMAMGNRSHLGALCVVNVSCGNLSIGDDVAVGPGTKVIVYSNHYEAGKKISDIRLCKDIVIGNNVFIGANCTLLPGTVIEDNVVVGAGSVVKGLLQSNSIYAGIPCKKLKDGWYD